MMEFRQDRKDFPEGFVCQPIDQRGNVNFPFRAKINKILHTGSPFQSNGELLQARIKRGGFVLCADQIHEG